MRIEELHLKNFRCFKDLDIKFPKPNPKHDLAVFIGLNGSGKTAILDAIELLLNNYSENNKFKSNNIKYTVDDIHQDSSSTEGEILFKYPNYSVQWKLIFDRENKSEKIVVQNKTSLEKYKIPITLSDFGNQIPRGQFLFVYYKTDKVDIYVMGVKACKTNFIGFEKWFEDEENLENQLKLESRNFNFSNPRLAVVREAINIFFDSIEGVTFSDIRVKRNISEHKITGSYENELAKHSSYLSIKCNDRELKFSQLSKGQKLLLHIVGDIAYKIVSASFVTDGVDMYDEHGAREYVYSCFDDEKITDILSARGVVLIDEIELHLHPQWQREVIPALQKTFPNIQFIVTTHSPQVLSNVKKENIFILEDGKIIENTPHTEGRDVNSILYELFGVEKRPKVYKDKISDFYNALEDEKIVEAEMILTELTELFGEQDSEIVKANLHLKFATEE